MATTVTTVTAKSRAQQAEPYLSDYIEIPAKGNLGKEGELMSDFEMLSIMLMVLGIVVSILIAYINHTKK